MDEEKKNFIEIEGIGKITFRKLTKSDYFTIRDESIETKIMDGNEIQKLLTGTYEKLTLIFGIESAPFYNESWTPGLEIKGRLRKQRESEFDNSDFIMQDADKLFKEILEFNKVDQEEIDRIRKKQSNT